MLHIRDHKFGTTLTVMLYICRTWIAMFLDLITSHMGQEPAAKVENIPQSILNIRKCPLLFLPLDLFPLSFFLVDWTQGFQHWATISLFILKQGLTKSLSCPSHTQPSCLSFLQCCPRALLAGGLLSPSITEVLGSFHSFAQPTFMEKLLCVQNNR